MAEWHQRPDGSWIQGETIDEMRARIAREKQAEKDHWAKRYAEIDAQQAANREERERPLREKQAAAEAVRLAQENERRVAKEAQRRETTLRAYKDNNGDPTKFDEWYAQRSEELLTQETMAQIQREKVEFERAFRSW